MVYLFINIIFHSVKVSIEQENHPNKWNLKPVFLSTSIYGLHTKKDVHAFVFRMIFVYQINGSQIKYRDVFCFEKKRKIVLFWLVHFIFTENFIAKKKMLLFYHFLHIKKDSV